jgi:hypothetical protein
MTNTNRQSIPAAYSREVKVDSTIHTAQYHDNLSAPHRTSILHVTPQFGV